MESSLQHLQTMALMVQILPMILLPTPLESMPIRFQALDQSPRVIMPRGVILVQLMK